MNIEIITTDTSTHDAIIESIEEMGHKARLSICLNKSDLDDVVQRKPDLVILSKKNILIENEEYICLSEYFETNNINFSGSSKEALKYDSDKILTKSYLKEQGHNTANYFTATPGEYINDNKIPIRYPLFIKPNSSAYGNGIDDLSYVTNYMQFESKVLSLYTTYNEPILVEEYLESQEFTVALIKTKNGDLLVSAIEVIPTKSQNGIKVLGLKTRAENKEEFIKTQDSELINRVKNIAVNAFMDLGARDFAQVDIKTNSYGHCFFMGVNLLPDIKDVSSYLVKAFEIEHGFSYNKIIEIIIDKGISRV